MAILDNYNINLSTVLKVGSILIAIVVWWMTFSGQMSAFVNTTATQHNDLLRQHRESIPLLRQICRNTAKTEMSQDKCDLPGD